MTFMKIKFPDILQSRRIIIYIIFLFILRLREHVQDPDKLPILIFPEGTCINNTSVMQFKKGSFEVNLYIIAHSRMG